MSTILVLGIPGSGKTTVSQLLAAHLDGQLLSASSALREYCEAHPATAVRWQIRWTRGENAPDDEVLPVLWRAYSRSAKPVVLDGYPRTPSQLWDFKQRGGRIDLAILLRVNETIAQDRISRRSQAEARVDDLKSIAQRRIQHESGVIDELIGDGGLASQLKALDATRESPLELCDRIAVLLSSLGQ